MVIGIIGENCSGKSTLADAIGQAIGAEVVTGKDYLRMAKSAAAAEQLFRGKLERAMTDGHLIYVISESEHIRLLPEGAIRILVYADLDTIQRRFAARLHGNLPAPVAAMLERKHGAFDGGTYDFRFDGANGDAAALCAEISARIERAG